jgi:hypothetical protein
VSPENFPVTLYARASLDPAKPPRVVPENLPSGSSARFSIGTLARASATVPDKRPCLLVRRTSRSPQCPVPGNARPCTIQIPSASLVGAVVAVSKAPTGKTPANEAHTAITRKYNNPGNTVRSPRSITRPPDLEAPPRLEDEAGDPVKLIWLRSSSSRNRRLRFSRLTPVGWLCRGEEDTCYLGG